MANQKYMCPSCGWIGTEDEMDADYCDDGDGGEAWTNWMCPGCGTWQSGVHDYIEVKDEDN
jgi:rubredoxin